MFLVHVMDMLAYIILVLKTFDNFVYVCIYIFVFIYLHLELISFVSKLHVRLLEEKVFVFYAYY